MERECTVLSKPDDGACGGGGNVTGLSSKAVFFIPSSLLSLILLGSKSGKGRKPYPPSSSFLFGDNHGGDERSFSIMFVLHLFSYFGLDGERDVKQGATVRLRFLWRLHTRELQCGHSVDMPFLSTSSMSYSTFTKLLVHNAKASAILAAMLSLLPESKDWPL
ncbi:hypothetical protein Lal_00026585 [Lupinus albus]|nr:hypothetical protein Lal_00026585 [Lupinus albus]